MKMFISCPVGRTFDTFFSENNIDIANSLYDTVWNPYDRNLEADEVSELAEGCDVYMTVWGSPPLCAEILDSVPTLRLVAHLGGDPRYFMCPEARERGIRAISGLRYYDSAVAEGILAYILTALRNIPEYSYRLKYKRDWKHSWDVCRTLIGKTVGIINYTGVAARLARLLSVFDVRILVYSPRPVPKSELHQASAIQLPLTEVVGASDVLCVLEPNCIDGYHMINGEVISEIKNGALLVNAASGGVVDQLSLVAALSAGRFFAVLDAYEKEPPDSDDMMFNLQNVIMMPHMAGSVTDIREKVTRELLLESYEYLFCGAKLKNEVKYKSRRSHTV